MKTKIGKNANYFWNKYNAKICLLFLTMKSGIGFRYFDLYPILQKKIKTKKFFNQ